MRLRDNSEVEEELPDWAKDFVNIQLSKLPADILVFPATAKESEDLSDEQLIFSYDWLKKEYWTTNVMGWLGKGSERITIHSRFDDGREDFFLRYMIEKVFEANIVNFDLSTSQGMFDLLPFLFPMYLETALKKGIYKTYVKKQYNDSQVKGTINIARHIKQNTPFLGKIAYDMRELTADNNITQLIRHTIEFIKSDKKAVKLHERSVRKIFEVTPSYRRADKSKIMQANLAIKNPYFHDYRPLIELCQMILRGKKSSFGKDKQKVHGILFDGAWLWEEYLATILTDYKHPRGNESIYQVGNRAQVRPDFYNDESKIIIDTKYKNVQRDGIKREDRFQIISYLHYKKFDKAGILYPSTETKSETEGIMKGLGGEIFKISLKIPQNCAPYDEFVEEIKAEEENLIVEMGVKEKEL
ncbi:MAG: McrC family protein [Streptococcaceae bacterium]|jgi:5-methylcytosine-specific restriction endonuclease McrBC regulatory subunit McrC|nr:McrC family protein [Streptococcaceae bacterium]